MVGCRDYFCNENTFWIKLFCKVLPPFEPFLYSWYDEDSNFKWKEEVTMNTFMKKLMMLSLIGLSAFTMEAVPGRGSKVRGSVGRGPVVQLPQNQAGDPVAPVDKQFTAEEKAALEKQVAQRSGLWTSGISAALLYGYTLKNFEIARKYPMYTLGLLGATYVVSNSTNLGLDAWTYEEFMKARQAEGWGTKGLSLAMYNIGSAVYNADADKIAKSAWGNPLQTVALGIATFEAIKYMTSGAVVKKAAETVVSAVKQDTPSVAAAA